MEPTAMTTIDLREKLAKAGQLFSNWPDWKQTVLRDSMRGKVLTPRVVSAKGSNCEAEAASKQKKPKS